MSVSRIDGRDRAVCEYVCKRLFPSVIYWTEVLDVTLH